MEFVYSVLGVAKWLLVIAVVLVGLLAYFQNKLLYMPKIPDLPLSPAENPLPYRNPGNLNLGYEEVVIDSTDNVKLRGWLILADKHNGKTIIYYHENAGNIGTRLGMVRLLLSQTQCNVLLVAYRGYSDSNGIPTEAGLKSDGMAIIRYAASHPKIGEKNIYILGRSLGGAVGAYVASHPDTKKFVQKIIMEVTFTSIPDMVDVLFRLLSPLKSLILRNHWRTIDLIKEIDCPILFVKASDDMLIPISQMESLINQAKKYSKEIKEFTVAGANHNMVAEVNPQQYFKKVNQFFTGDYS